MTYLGTYDLPAHLLTRYPGNPRRGDVNAIRESIRTHGQYRALVVRAHDRDDPTAGGTVLAGNHTLAAIIAEHAETHADDPDEHDSIRAGNKPGTTAIVRVEMHDVDDATAAKIVAVDNRAADLGEYDERLLAELLSGLDDLAGTGYDEDDLAELEQSITGSVQELPNVLADPDDQDATPPRDPYCKPGDLWHLGRHRLAVGDSTDTGTWERLLEDRRADMIWTDPPYGVSYVGKTAQAMTIENDKLDGEALTAFLRGVLGVALTHTRPGACWYVASPPGPAALSFMTVLQELEVLRQGLVWVKDRFVLGRSDYHYRHEPVWYGWTPGAAHHPVPDRTQDSVHEVPRPSRNGDHPTMKPVALIARHITNSTDPDDLVVDPFGGSGSTLLAAHTTGRVAAVIELDPKYADVICRRYQEITGEKPVRDGEPHDFEAAA